MNGRRAPRLMLVTDRRRATFPLPELCRRAVAGGVDAVQIREKDAGEQDLLRLATEVVAAVAGEAVVIVNGAIDVATRLGIGVHLPAAERGSLDRAVAAVRGPVGLSVHSPVAAAAGTNATYLIAGHVYVTGSKPGLPPIGPDGLTAIAGAAIPPVLAIGGITPERVAAVIAAGARGVAVLSAINDAPDPESAARAFALKLEDAMSDVNTTSTLRLTVNGKPAEIPAGSTILDFLTARGHHDRMVVVELNGRIVRRPSFAETILAEGDRVEIVHFVGGG